RILGPASFLCPIRPAPRTSRLPSPTLFRSAEVVQELPDARHVALVHRVADEGVGRVEHGGIVAARRLQRAQPGVYVFGRKFGFQALEAAGPGIHGGVLHTDGGTGRGSWRGHARQEMDRGQPAYHRPPRRARRRSHAYPEAWGI